MDIDDIKQFENAVDELIKGKPAVQEKIAVEKTEVSGNEEDEADKVIDKNGNDLNGDSGHSSLDDSSLNKSDKNEHSKAPAISVGDEKAVVDDVDPNSVDSQATDEETGDVPLPVLTPIEDVYGMLEGSFPSSPIIGSSMPGLFPISENSNASQASDAKSHEEAESVIKIVVEESVAEKPDDLDSSFDDEDESRLVIDEPNKSIDQSDVVISEDDEDLVDESFSNDDDSDLFEEEDDDLIIEDEGTTEDKEYPIEESPSPVSVEEDDLPDKEIPPPQAEDKTRDDQLVDTEKAPSEEPTTTEVENSMLCNEEFRSPEKSSKSAPPNDNDDLLDKLISELAPSDPKPPPAKAPIPRKEGQKRSFVDSLLSKIRESSDSSESESPSKLQKLLSESEDDLLVEIETPIRFNAPKNPNLLATPIVRNQRSASSAFVSNEEEYNQMVAKHNKVTRKPSYLEDRSQMGSKSEVPRMQAPDLLSNSQRPKTLAEKRLLINGNNMKVLMIEQESKIYKQVQRKNSKMDINYQLLDSMINEDVPISSGPFKVLTWLRTREGNFIQNFVNVNGANYKLNGSRGNHKSKYLPDLTTKPFPSRQTTYLRPHQCCAGGRIRKRALEKVMASKSVQKFVLETSTDVHMRMDTKLLDNQLTSIKPRPLSKKVDFINANRKDFVLDEDAAFLGDYSAYTMPNVSLEVKVQPKTALDQCAKRYLKEILPHRDLSENWCEFALTALMPIDEEEKNKEVFEFPVPYIGDKQTILVREILRRKESNEQLRIPPYTEEDEDEDDMEWTFCKDYDKTDEIESEVVDIIKDLTNSVFINLNDDLFTQEDPHDRNIASTLSPMKVKEAIDELSDLPKFDPVKKTLKELRRLNANVFKSDSTCIDDVSSHL